MVFEYFVRPLVSHYYHRIIQRATRINWSLFGSTNGISYRGVHAFHEPSDGEAGTF